MGTDIFRKYIWLISTIDKKNGISLRELNNLYQSNINLSNGERINERTFYRWRNKIFEIFDIDIVCRHNEYYIDNKDSLHDNSLRLWLMNSIATHNMVSENFKLRDRISIEKQPSSEKHLHTILFAMQSNNKMIINYQKFNGVVEENLLVAPYGLKSFRRRWYVLVKREDNNFRTYALDRIKQITITDTSFLMPDDFSMEVFFRNYFGIFTNPEIEPQRIEIKVFAEERNYINTLPLHESQKEEIKEDNYSIFSFYLAPTLDFVMELLSFGKNIEVLSPASLRKRISNILQETIGYYK